MSVVALGLLAGCKPAPETINGYGDPMENELAKAPPAPLPPAVKDSRTYRCKDNSLIYVDFLADDLTANLRTEKEGLPTKLVAPEKGKPFEAAGGYKVEGSGKQITATLPGKDALGCKSS
jgi:hypothetical protein